MRSLVDVLRTVAPNVSRKQFGQIVRALLISPLLTDEELGEAIALTIGTAVFGEPVPYAPPPAPETVVAIEDILAEFFVKNHRRGIVKLAQAMGWRVVQIIDYVSDHPNYTIYTSPKTGKVYVQRG